MGAMALPVSHACRAAAANKGRLFQSRFVGFMHTLSELRQGKLKGLRRLRLAEDLSEFPSEIFDLAETLEILDLSGNRLSRLPDDLPRLHKLRILFCSDNPFTELPAVLGACPALEMVGFKANRIERVPAAALPARLRWLILTDNRIAELPEALGQCANLQKLMLAGNRLTALPESLAQCRRLELLRIAANQLRALPDWLLTLPRLSWLAFAGNPLAQALEEQALQESPVAAIDWRDLVLQERLGEGASGIIHRAEQRCSGGERAVAVKLFKGAVTSDGLPHCEMAACMQAGEHANLIPVLGKLAGHPAATPGLVMALIEPSFANLAGPPSLASCTRDVYAPETRFKPAVALRMALGIASAARHLHARGIMHGDLYAHNILQGGDGRAVIGDFGAASFYPPANPVLAPGLERLEVRAFGCLLEELLERIDRVAVNTHLLAELNALQARCLAENPGDRPSFADIEASLSGCGQFLIA